MSLPRQELTDYMDLSTRWYECRLQKVQFSLFLTFSSHLSVKVAIACFSVKQQEKVNFYHNFQEFRLSCCLVYMMDGFVIPSVSIAVLLFQTLANRWRKWF